MPCEKSILYALYFYIYIRPNDDLVHTLHTITVHKYTQRVKQKSSQGIVFCGFYLVFMCIIINNMTQLSATYRQWLHSFWVQTFYDKSCWCVFFLQCVIIIFKVSFIWYLSFTIYTTHDVSIKRKINLHERAVCGDDVEIYS